jgi:segregation and condensation protein B
MAGSPDRPSEPTPLELGQAAASQLGGEWHLDADDPGETGKESPPKELPPTPPNPGPRRPFPRLASQDPEPDAVPPSPEQIVEAMLFVGGHPLTPPVACTAVRGLTAEGFQAAVDSLNRRYRSQNRPYAIQRRDEGFVLALLPTHRGLRERLFGGPRETRLTQPALDVLAVVAYRQPVAKAEVDAVRGTDSGSVLRQLVRLGLVAVQHRAESGSREVRYGTTPRFLQVFGLASLDELPRLGDTESLSG